MWRKGNDILLFCVFVCKCREIKCMCYKTFSKHRAGVQLYNRIAPFEDRNRVWGGRSGRTAVLTEYRAVPARSTRLYLRARKDELAAAEPISYLLCLPILLTLSQQYKSNFHRVESLTDVVLPKCSKRPERKGRRRPPEAELVSRGAEGEVDHVRMHHKTP